MVGPSHICYYNDLFSPILFILNGGTKKHILCYPLHKGVGLGHYTRAFSCLSKRWIYD